MGSRHSKSGRLTSTRALGWGGRGAHRVRHIEDAADAERRVRPVVQGVARPVMGLRDVAVELLMLPLTHVLGVHHPDCLETEEQGCCFRHTFPTCGWSLRCPVLDRHTDTHTDGSETSAPSPAQCQEERGGKTWTRPHMTNTNCQGVRGSGKVIEPERDTASRRSHQLEP